MCAAEDDDQEVAVELAIAPYRPRSTNHDVAMVETDLHYFRQQYNQDQLARGKMYSRLRKGLDKIDTIEKKMGNQKSFLAGVGFCASMVGGILAVVFQPIWARITGGHV